MGSLVHTFSKQVNLACAENYQDVEQKLDTIPREKNRRALLIQ